MNNKEEKGRANAFGLFTRLTAASGSSNDVRPRKELTRAKETTVHKYYLALFESIKLFTYYAP